MGSPKLGQGTMHRLYPLSEALSRILLIEFDGEYNCVLTLANTKVNETAK